MPSVSQLKNRLEALLAKAGADSLARERKQVARASSKTEIRILGTGLRDILGKRFGDKWAAELDEAIGRETTVQDDPPSQPHSLPPSTLPPAQLTMAPEAAAPHASRFGTQETYSAIKQQAPGQRLESLRAYLKHAAVELLGDNSAPLEQKIAAAKGVNELRGVARAMAEIARLTHSETTVDRFTQKLQALFAAVEEANSH